jgi:hypothetical protein
MVLDLFNLAFNKAKIAIINTLFNLELKNKKKDTNNNKKLNFGDYIIETIPLRKPKKP